MCLCGSISAIHHPAFSSLSGLCWMQGSTLWLDTACKDLFVTCPYFVWLLYVWCINNVHLQYGERPMKYGELYRQILSEEPSLNSIACSMLWIWGAACSNHNITITLDSGIRDFPMASKIMDTLNSKMIITVHSILLASTREEIISGPSLAASASALRPCHCVSPISVRVDRSQQYTHSPQRQKQQ